jgi:hypothetical protein
MLCCNSAALLNKKVREDFQQKAIYIKDAQRLVTEINMLKVVKR